METLELRSASDDSEFDAGKRRVLSSHDDGATVERVLALASDHDPANLLTFILARNC